MEQDIKRIPLLIFSFKSMTGFRRFSSIGHLKVLRKSLDEDMKALGAPVSAELYATASFFSALFFGLFFGSIIFAVTTVLPGQIAIRYPLSFAIGFLLFFMMFMLYLFYPGIIRKKIASRESKDLLFALREIVMSVESGVPLFDAMKNVSLANYGYVSYDFARVVRKIESGIFERDAVLDLAIQSQNEYLRRAAWQMVNALETGSKVGHALSSIILVLEKQINREIKNYSSTLNFIMLIYILVAAAIPSLGVTFLVLLSSFGGAGVDSLTVFGILGVSFFTQGIMLGYVNATRPAIFGG